MKILFTTLNSKYIHSSLALKYLHESCMKDHKDLSVTEFSINNDDTFIFTEMMRGGYDVICFSCYIWNITRTLGLIEDIKMANPDVKIIVGGPEVSFDGKELMGRAPFIDFIIAGEGEIALKQLLNAVALSRDSGLCSIKGLSYRSQGNILVNQAQKLLEPHEIPFPYGHSPMDPNKILYYESSRGCPFHCTYCISSALEGVRFLPLDRVKKELTYFMDKEVRQVKFIDRTFNADLERCKEILQFLLDADKGKTNFHLEVCGDSLDMKTIELLQGARAGLFQLEIGVQSTYEKALAHSGRTCNLEKLEENVKLLLQKNNVHLHLDLIAGLPYETFPIFKESFNRVYRMEPHVLQLGFLKMIKGARIRKDAKKYGYVYRSREPYEIISNDFISANELIRLKEVENILDLLLNRGGFRTVLRYYLAKYSLEPFDFFEDFATFFYQNNFQLRAPGKDFMYEVFTQYIGEKELEGEERVILKELLLYDKLLMAGKSAYIDRDIADEVHQMLRADEIASEINPDKGVYKTPAKELMKQINCREFLYDIFKYAKGNQSSQVEKSKNICIFVSGRKNVVGESYVICRHNL